MGSEHLSIKLATVLVILNFVGKSFGEKDSPPCFVKFENAEKYKQGALDCIKQIKPKIASKYPNATTDEELLEAFIPDVIKGNFTDDQCYVECFLSHAKILSSDGHLDKSKFLTEFKSNASEAYTETMFGMWNTCVDKTVELAKPDGGFKSNPCKYSAKLQLCVMEEGKKSADKLKKTC